MIGNKNILLLLTILLNGCVRLRGKIALDFHPRDFDYYIAKLAEIFEFVDILLAILYKIYYY